MTSIISLKAEQILIRDVHLLLKLYDQASVYVHLLLELFLDSTELRNLDKIIAGRWINQAAVKNTVRT